MLGLIAGTASLAQTTTLSDPSTVMFTSASEKLKLEIAPEASTATIQLLDAKKHVLYNRQVDLQNGFRQLFNITDLEPGTYQLAIRTKQGLRVAKTFVIDELPAHKQVTLNA